MTDAEHGFEPKWTPGEWSREGISEVWANDHPSSAVARVYPQPGQTDANAELISLAPELAAAVLAFAPRYLHHLNGDVHEIAEQLCDLAERLRMIGADDAS